MPAAPLVELERVSVTYPDASAPTPRDVSLRVDSGEVVLLLGPSGCGKSTLALTFNGLIPHAHDAELDGIIRIDGQDTRETTPAELSRDVAMVFQDPDAQIVTGSLLDEVAFALENLLLPVDEVLSRAETALRTVGLWERRDDDPSVLSGGGRQRLAVACALAMRPRLLVLDEPTANLDPAGTADVYSALRDLVADSADRAIILIEHDVEAALPLATRVVVLDRVGRVALDGAPEEIFTARQDELSELGVWRPLPAVSAPGEAPRPDTRSAITVDRLTVTRGRGAASRTLLHEVSLQIPSGSFTAIIGPNGAGKTTLAQALAGVVPPPRGAVQIDAGDRLIDPSRARPRDLARHVGFVFQNPEHQFVTHTVHDELAHGLRRMPPADRGARVDEILDRFDLAEHAERHPFRLSGGQKRRLSVGTALIAGVDDPSASILVLDEPTFGQDRARAEELLSLLDTLHRAGTTVIVVTHDPQLVERHATHVAALSDGRLRAFGPTAEVLPLVREAEFWGDGAGVDGMAGVASTPAADAACDRPVSTSRPSAAAIDVRGEAGAAGGVRGEAGAGAAGGVRGGTRADGGRGRKRAPLEHLDPLALLVATLPAMIGLVFTRDIATPALTLALSYAVLLLGAPHTRRLAMWLCLILPAMAVAIGAGFTLWSGPETGVATGLRLTALLALALIPGLNTHGTEFVRSAVTHLRVPYRIGYAALAAYRFVPRFRHELDVIRSAHRVRDTNGNPLSRGLSAIVPLLASAIRHAERVALAMDARAFGAFATRTERAAPRWRARDSVALAVGWAASAALFIVGLIVL